MLSGITEFETQRPFYACQGNTATCQGSAISNPSMRAYAVTDTTLPALVPSTQYIADIELVVTAPPIILLTSTGTNTYYFAFNYTGKATAYPFYDYTKNVPQPPCVVCGNVSGSGFGGITIVHNIDASGEFFIPQSETLVFAPEPGTFLLGVGALALLSRRAWNVRTVAGVK